MGDAVERETSLHQAANARQVGVRRAVGSKVNEAEKPNIGEFFLMAKFIRRKLHCENCTRHFVGLLAERSIIPKEPYERQN